MSTSDLYILNQKSTTHLVEFRNGWGSAPRCWDYLASKYLSSLGRYSMYSDVMNKKVWALSSDTTVAEEDRIALMMTLDGAYVPVANLRKAGEACVKFGAACENGQTVNHWPAIGEELLRVADEKHNRHARGVCLSCTSVGDPWLGADPNTLKKAWPIFKSV
jgi:hypothetical protein